MEHGTLIELAKVVRSKNSGPFELTYDIIFRSRRVYERVRDQRRIDRRWAARVLGVRPGRVLNLVFFDPVGAVKITIGRPVPSGALGDTDIYGAQQHAPLLDAVVSWKE
jgi:hypothetical protein